ncbi:hypothetical protein ACWDA7_09820 [Streptomyces sp. NPDC001156]
MALGKVFIGGGWLGAKVVLALMAATGAVAARGLALASGCGRRRAAIAGLVVGVSPNLLLWDAWGLKEGLITSLVLWTLLLQARARFSLACVGTLLSTQACLYTRPPTALFIAVALLARARLRRAHLTGWLIIMAIGVVFVLPRALTLFGFVHSLEVVHGVPLEFTAGYGSRNLLSHPQYFGVVLFDPLPWKLDPGPTQWLRPGTIIWIASLALAPMSLRRAWADSIGIGRSAVVASFSYAATYVVTFGATFYRQRSLLECMLAILIVVYSPRLSLISVIAKVQVWLAVVAGLAVLQSRSLTPTVWSKVMALCVMIVGALLALIPRPLDVSSRGVHECPPIRLRQRPSYSGGATKPDGVA